MGWPTPVRPPAPGIMEDRGERNRTALLEARENPSAPPVKCPKDRHILAPDNAPPGPHYGPGGYELCPPAILTGFGLPLIKAQRRRSLLSGIMVKGCQKRTVGLLGKPEKCKIDPHYPFPVIQLVRDQRIQQISQFQ